MKNILYTLIMVVVMPIAIFAPSVLVAYLLWDWSWLVALIAFSFVYGIVSETLRYLVYKFGGRW